MTYKLKITSDTEIHYVKKTFATIAEAKEEAAIRCCKYYLDGERNLQPEITEAENEP